MFNLRATHNKLGKKSTLSTVVGWLAATMKAKFQLLLRLCVVAFVVVAAAVRIREFFGIMCAVHPASQGFGYWSFPDACVYGAVVEAKGSCKDGGFGIVRVRKKINSSSSRKSTVQLK